MKLKRKIDKNELKVYVTMHNNTRLMGFFYLATEERLQDLMNDDRSFLPLHMVGKNNKKSTLMISKRYIEKVEELHAGAEALEIEEQWTGVDRRVSDERRAQSIELQVDPIHSEAEEQSEPGNSN